MQRAIVIGCLVFQGLLAAVVVAEPGSLGIPPVVVAWGSILNVGIGVLLNQLNRMQEPTTSDPPVGTVWTPPHG